MIEQELAQKFVAGETLTGKDAARFMEKLITSSPWRPWVQFALVFLEFDHVASAKHILRELLINVPE